MRSVTCLRFYALREPGDLRLEPRLRDVGSSSSTRSPSRWLQLLPRDRGQPAAHFTSREQHRHLPADRPPILPVLPELAGRAPATRPRDPMAPSIGPLHRASPSSRLRRSRSQRCRRRPACRHEAEAAHAAAARATPDRRAASRGRAPPRSPPRSDPSILLVWFRSSDSKNQKSGQSCHFSRL